MYVRYGFRMAMRSLLITLAALIVLGGAVSYFLDVRNLSLGGGSGIVCTMDVKLCPDGSYVGRTGPNCEFTPCPQPLSSGIRGTVMLGPTCPVMRDPPDPNCADRGYATKISVFRASNNNLVATTKSDAQGIFEVSLPAGAYIVSAEGGQMLPSCSPVHVTVSANNYVSATIQCDTGIR